MKRFFITILSIFLLAIAHSSKAELIAFDLTSDLEFNRNLLHFANDYRDHFLQSDDVFWRFTAQEHDLPPQLIDASGSSSASDQLGLLAPDFSGSVFAAVDTVNSAGLVSPELSGFASAYWTFDVMGYQYLSLLLDVAAMGDFESNDSFRIDAKLDSQNYQSLWTSTVDTSGQANYQLNSGDTISLNDPLYFGGTQMSNRFKTLSSDVLGFGEQLTIRFSARADGGSEVFGLKEMRITGQAMELNEPNSLSTFCILLLVLLLRHQGYSINWRRAIAGSSLRINWTGTRLANIARSSVHSGAMKTAK